MEQRPIPGFDGYAITNEGVVISRHGRPLSFYLDKDGYRRVTLAVTRGKNAKRVHCGIHQLVCLVFNGPAPAGMQVRHLDGSKANNVPSNLKWGTHLANIRDKHTHGTMPRGANHPMAKLTAEQVEIVRFYIVLGMSNVEIAEMFSVDNSTVSCIRTGKTWREHVA